MLPQVHKTRLRQVIRPIVVLFSASVVTEDHASLAKVRNSKGDSHMKKILAAVIGTALWATGAFALTSSVPHPAHQDFVPVSFITNAAAYSFGGRVDSVTARRVGAAGASSVLDTTVAISTAGWALPPAMTGGATDTSAVWCKLLVYAALDGGDDGCESGADSLAVAMQVSADGTTWATTAALPAQTISGGTGPIVSRNNQTILNGAFKDDLSLNGAAVANGQPIWQFVYKYRGINNLPSSISSDGAFMWPYIRFVLSLHDAKGYKIHAKVAVLKVAE